MITTLIEKNGGGSGNNNVGVYIQVTRGVAKRDFPPPKGLTQTVFMMVNPLATPKPEIYTKGVSCVSLDDIRWLKCNIKSVALIGAVLLKHESNQAGADDAVMFRDGYLPDSAASNRAAV